MSCEDARHSVPSPLVGEDREGGATSTAVVSNPTPDKRRSNTPEAASRTVRYRHPPSLSLPHKGGGNAVALLFTPATLHLRSRLSMYAGASAKAEIRGDDTGGCGSYSITSFCSRMTLAQVAVSVLMYWANSSGVAAIDSNSCGAMNFSWNDGSLRIFLTSALIFITTSGGVPAVVASPNQVLAS